MFPQAPNGPRNPFGRGRVALFFGFITAASLAASWHCLQKRLELGPAATVEIVDKAGTHVYPATWAGVGLFMIGIGAATMGRIVWKAW